MRVSAVLIVLAVGAGAVFAQNPGDQVRYDQHKLVRVTLPSEPDIRAMLAVSELHLACRLGTGEQLFVVPPGRIEALNATGLAYVVVSENVQDLIDQERSAIQTRGGAWFDTFHTRDEINAYIDTLVALRPDLATKVTIGQSLEGRDIFGIRLTGPGGPAGKPAVLFNACQHAREWASPPVPMYIADQFIRNYDTDPQLASLLDGLTLYLVPVVNPDGYVYTWTSNRFWRKNRRNNGGGLFGVDLNRNWAMGWGGEGSSSNPDSETYRGTAAFSEPETQALRDFILAHPEIRAHIDFHSYSQLILSPWGFSTGEPDEPDRTIFRQLNDAVQAAILGVHGEFYVAGPAGATLYLAAGDMPDWTYGERGALGWTIELRPAGTPGFELPPEEIRPTVEENFAAILVLADYVANQVDFGFPNGLPETLAPGQATTIAVDIDGPIAAGSESLFYRVDGGAFVETSLTDLGGGAYEGMLPGQSCLASVDYYFQVTTQAGADRTSPPGAPGSAHSAAAGDLSDVFRDDFEADLGWSVQNVALTDGAWNRGVPAGAGDRGDPTSDYDGSGACYLTDNAPGNSDVDGGPTRLVSPAFDLSAPGAYRVGYGRWFQNDDGDEDRLAVEISNDNGANWTLVEGVPGGGGWTWTRFNVADYVAPTSQVVVRFSATDNPNDSVTEAGIDAFELTVVACDAAPCPGDLNGDGDRDLADLSVLLSNFGAPSGASDDDGDMDGDGDVDLADLSQFLALFGEACA